MHTVVTVDGGAQAGPARAGRMMNGMLGKPVGDDRRGTHGVGTHRVASMGCDITHGDGETAQHHRARRIHGDGG